ncbi:MAG: sulfotransferase domain-containing protein [Deltaproteobacteria bacterium]|jgi:hypothetical protein|nr:sulfotransferase domain-containing protein [Deltaproteobacteria bacterium]MBW2497955.1 sulfotransferase domain-containing protein [Deltaproteobacteria bacterium]
MESELERRRAASFDEFTERFARLFDPESFERGLAFRPEPSDVLISPFAKCGTTWLQQIVHALRTRGDLDFDDISRVVPWIETAGSLGLDLDAPQRARPRAFKSHLSWDHIPKGGRYIVSIRNPADALVSMYRFIEGWIFEPGAFPIEKLARERFLQRGSGQDYWSHLASWWRVRDRDDVLLLSYEGMRRNPEGAVRRVADFAGIALDDELLDLVLAQSSLEFMLAHKDRFDDRMMRERSETVAMLPPGADSSKVRKGEVGAHRYELGEDVMAELDAVWRETIQAELGFEDYAAMEAEAFARLS